MAWMAHEFKSHYDDRAVPLRSLEDLERRLKIRCPPGTVLVDGKAYFGFAGVSLRAQIRMPKQALPAFLAQPSLRQDPSRLSEGTAPNLPSKAAISAVAAEIKKAAAAPPRS
jgi:hypothetical protein